MRTTRPTEGAAVGDEAVVSSVARAFVGSSKVVEVAGSESACVSSEAALGPRSESIAVAASVK